ncbi:EAL domain-containing response regulator [Bradyrhizobium sp. LHD-71]|uniref:EAL domain-containing response regulator n=1 Tax=Bradyrhizobium sp. LHD-71 TaxID=3072141 RepID=UPI00280EF793|nr:EAL domain-containing response regulator [Bradyrhizobium sp. LHD-71]MDQ8732585.1 EAL domain-containing response regulator [Bradyrhizobium sp. LHD-71]
MGIAFQADARRTFGKRRIAPRACVVDSKQHLQTFLSEALEELGFIVCRCASAESLGAALGTHFPDIVIFGLSAGGMEAAGALETASANGFKGKVLLLGPAASPMVTAVHAYGEGLRLSMLPVLKTPFSDRDLRGAVSDFIPVEAPPAPPVDAAEALEAGWLELWYQPKLDSKTLALHSAEALVRLRHPTWGIVPPAYFVPAETDPNFQALSKFVIARALQDWRYFVTKHGRIQIAINLPLSFFRNLGAAQLLCQMLPKHAAFDGLIVEMNGAEIAEDLSFSNELARTLRFHNIGISIADLGEEWPTLIEADEFPFVEVKLDQTFVSGCADDRLRRAACRQIVDFAQSSGARTVAEGVENRDDFLVMRELGVDLIQGFMFAKPMPAQKFARFHIGRLEAPA